MNIFEFLGKPSDFRDEGKIFQYVKHWDEVNPKQSLGILHKHVTFPMMAQKKEDGVFCAVVVRRDGAVALFNRTGKTLTNVEHLVEYYEASPDEDDIDCGVYFGELVNSELSLEELSGIVNPNRVNELDDVRKELSLKSSIKFFDYLTICEFISGRSDAKYSVRHCNLSAKMGYYSDVLMYTVVDNETELDNYAQLLIDQGHEGAVFKQDCGWLAGAKDWHQMKKVRSVSYDLECIGYEEGSGKYSGKVANLLFRFKGGKVVKAMLGKGWTHADAELLFGYINYPESVGMTQYTHKDSPIGKIYRVYGLQPSSKNGVIRLPKVGELRHDKAMADF